LDPDPGGLKRAKMKGENAAKRQIIRHKKYKINVIGIKMFDFIFIKIEHYILTLTKILFLTYTGITIQDQDLNGSTFVFKAGSGFT
jgi:hypothetical protein